MGDTASTGARKKVTLKVDPKQGANPTKKGTVVSNSDGK